MGAARKFESSSTPAVVSDDLPVSQRTAPSSSLRHFRPGFNVPADQRRLLEREFGPESVEAEIRRYPRAVRLGIVITGAVLSWVAVLGLAGAIAVLASHSTGA